MNIIRIIIATALGLCVILGFIALAAIWSARNTSDYEEHQ